MSSGTERADAAPRGGLKPLEVLVASTILTFLAWMLLPQTVRYVTDPAGIRADLSARARPLVERLAVARDARRASAPVPAPPVYPPAAPQSPHASVRAAAAANDPAPDAAPPAEEGPPAGSEDPRMTDPWGREYVFDLRLSGPAAEGGASSSRILALSAGPDGLWQTPFRGAAARSEPAGDDLLIAVTLD